MCKKTIVVDDEDMSRFTEELLRLVKRYIDLSKEMREELDWFGFEYDHVGEAWSLLGRYGSEDVQDLIRYRKRCTDEFDSILRTAMRFHVITQDEYSRVLYSFNNINVKPLTDRHFEKWEARMERALAALGK